MKEKIIFTVRQTKKIGSGDSIQRDAVPPNRL